MWNDCLAHVRGNQAIDGLREPYRSRVECFCSSNYIKVKECALQIETFPKNREHHDKRGSLLVEEKFQPTSDITKIDKIEADIKELVKVVKELTSSMAPGHSVSRNQYSTQGSRTNIDNRWCFNCQQEEHISHNCLNRDPQGPPVKQKMN
ncbi:2034_t:CDS:2 [Cetraspora pellucida]|uniref:2034_t:CDS:1 n=1 Tax=Cetraspora pellucida TaxID=1433469 RepID=A0A9N9NBX2_9GLOM|nr:2034_t:CDS:2 [Cetraspora pellucida]